MRNRPRSSPSLALRTGSPNDQAQAAVRLEALAAKSAGRESRNPAQPFLVRLLSESKNPDVRAAAMRGLATIWDYQCVPKMFELLDDSSPQVRQTAARALTRLIEFDAHFEANAPAQQLRRGHQAVASRVGELRGQDPQVLAAPHAGRGRKTRKGKLT